MRTKSIPAEWEFDCTVLHTARTQAGLSMENLAALSGVNLAAISRIESGQRLPKADTLAKLATTLGLSPTDFYRDISQKFANKES